MSKTKNLFICGMLFSAMSSGYAGGIGQLDVDTMGSRNAEVTGLHDYYTYAVSCTSNYNLVSTNTVMKDVTNLHDDGNLTLYVNPGEVTDSEGQHGVEHIFYFGMPVGSIHFYAQPDSTGVIDFSIVNTTLSNYSVTCSVNAQDITKVS